MSVQQVPDWEDKMRDEELLVLRRQIEEAPITADLHESRAAYEAMAGQFPLPEDVRIDVWALGGVPAERHTSTKSSRAGAILYLHGGGYVIGSLGTHRHFVAELSRQSGLDAFAIDYRLAPEHLYPAAIEDAVSAYRALLQLYEPHSIAVAGDSAGAGLVMAMLLSLRDQGLAQPACAYAISPWVDLAATGNSIETKAGEDPLASKELLLLMAERYLGGADPKMPLASPIYADLTGLAPILIQVGSAEILLDDSTRLAAAAGAAGVSVRLEIWPEMIHTWPVFYPVLSAGRKAIAKAIEFINVSTGEKASA